MMMALALEIAPWKHSGHNAQASICAASAQIARSFREKAGRNLTEWGAEESGI
jgi:hypothetical protein